MAIEFPINEVHTRVQELCDNALKFMAFRPLYVAVIQFLFQFYWNSCRDLVDERDNKICCASRDTFRSSLKFISFDWVEACERSSVRFRGKIYSRWLPWHHGNKKKAFQFVRKRYFPGINSREDKITIFGTVMDGWWWSWLLLWKKYFEQNTKPFFCLNKHSSEFEWENIHCLNMLNGFCSLMRVEEFLSNDLNFKYWDC